MFVSISGELNKEDIKFVAMREYELVDDELGVCPLYGVAGMNVEDAVIDFYIHKSLPVVPNLMRTFQYMERELKWEVKYAVSWNKIYNEKYRQYAEEIDRYLTLL
jgi:hypothetical protein